jgi:hypothetical protein
MGDYFVPKEQLLENLSIIKKPVLQLYNIREEYRGYNRPYLNVMNIPALFKLIIGLILFSIIFCSYILVIDFIFSFSTGLVALLALLGFFILGYLTVYSYLTMEHKINFLQISKRKKQNSIRINEIIKEEESLMKYIDSNGIPLSYSYPNAINTFEIYLKNHRADNLKECINLFEAERQHQQYINQLNTIQHVQELTYQEANQAKNIALFNLFSRR